MSRSRLRLLLLGGTTEASAIARALAGDPAIDCTLSLAGRTTAPLPQPVPVRSGGFGGAEGLAAWLAAQGIDAVVDATHPFAAAITANAVQAARAAGVPMLVVCRPPWQPRPGDRWTVVPDMQSAAAALGAAPRRVLLTIGQRDLAAFAAGVAHRYVIRSVEPPAAIPTGTEIISARGPFALEDEMTLLRDRHIEILVTKNSGGTATEAKLAAARALALPVILVARPPLPQAEVVADAAGALRWIHDTAGRKRGV